ncbi:glutathione S-transferase 1-like [Aricia agestis]|uniref:glutathione S-transferase 1-like n=1 Tax=Aricia agestis TaxID=91739 RepID=UPI001C20BEFE|nr:glutathione S-transferase 1-like [Aricia agestis]
MAPKFYSDELSPPCRAVMMLCEALNIPVEYVDTKLLNKDHMKEEYLKKNPMHTVPILEDGDLVIHDSHVILTYLTEKYGKNGSWYPKDLKQRALVDQKLYFEALMFTKMRAITYAAIFEGVRVPSEKVINELVQMFEFLEQFLSRTKFAAGDHMTIADISLIAVLSTINDIVPVDANKFPKTVAWMQEMQKQSFYQSKNVEGKEKLKAILKKFLDIMN